MDQTAPEHESCLDDRNLSLQAGDVDFPVQITMRGVQHYTQKAPSHVQVYILTSMTYSYKNQNGSH